MGADSRVKRASVLTVLGLLAVLAGAPAAQADPVVAAAGDTACDSSVPLASTCRQAATSDILVGMDPLDAVLALGDEQYECGELANFQAFYDPTWGRVKDKTYPVVGNHEYQTSGCLAGTTGGAAGYFNYFGDAATPLQPGCRVNCRGYYSFDLGDWHLIALNSNCGKAGGCGVGSPQETWLRTDLAATTKSCILAYMHHPRYSSKGGASTNIQPLWAAVYDGGADLVVTGHSHNYERFDRLGRGTDDSVEPTVDPIGMRQMVAGTGGREHHGFTTVRTGSQVRNHSTFGVLKLVLHLGSYDWEFLPEAGKTFTDSGSDTCQGAPRPGDTEQPSVPTGLSATPAGPSDVDLSWSASTDNVAVAGYGVYRDGTLIGTTSSTSFADPTAQPDTTYQYTVDAVDTVGNRSLQSLPALAVTPPTPTSFRSASFASTSTTTRSFTLQAPAGIVPGDVMLASIDVRALPTITPPAGWTLIRSDSNSTVMTMATYYRVVEAGEPASYTWGFSLKKAATGGIVAYSGIDTAAPIDAADGLVGTASSTIKAPSITTTVPHARLVGFFGTANNNTLTPPVGMLERGDVASTVGTDVTLEGADGIQSAPGATGQQKATASQKARGIGHLVALRPSG
jgi:calcineurin-like phosphoesterase family protein/fibronectin type III domain protein